LKESLITVKELSSILQVHPKTIYRQIRTLQIPHIKKGGIGIRFKEKDIQKWLESNQINYNHILETLPRLELPLEDYDRMLLKERSSALSKKDSKRWNYGFGAIYTKRTKQGAVRWYVDYRDETGKRVQRVTKHATSRSEALIELQTRVYEAFSNQNRIQPRRESVGFEEFSRIYLKDYSRVNKRSWKTDRSCLRSLGEFFGGFCLGRISSQLVERYKAMRLAQGVRNSTVNRDLAILRKMFNLAVEWGYLHERKVPRVRLFSEKDNLKERILTAEEEARLFDVSSEHLKPVLKIALHTGMRRGEILSLRWDDVDFEVRMIKVVRTKSGKVRFIPINEVLFNELKRLRSTSSGSGLVFCQNSVRTAFEGACRRAGIHGLRFHDLRHTFATRLVERGVDLITVKELLGHSSVTITERYTHTFSEQKRSAVDVLAAMKRETGIAGDLLNICDTSKKEEREKTLTSLFSVN